MASPADAALNLPHILHVIDVDEQIVQSLAVLAGACVTVIARRARRLMVALPASRAEPVFVGRFGVFDGDVEVDTQVAARVAAGAVGGRG